MKNFTTNQIPSGKKILNKTAQKLKKEIQGVTNDTITNYANK